jgi:hypothetical protein
LLWMPTRCSSCVSTSGQDADKARLGSGWVDSGLLFTEPDGSPLRPAEVTERFVELTRQAWLPPIRLHDLRRGAATLALAAGADMNVVYSALRHSTITVTMVTYTTVPPEVALAAAETPAKIIPGTRTALSGSRDRRRPPWTARKRKKCLQKTQIPRSPLKVTWGVRVRHQGLEPRTRWLRASCSAN